jgi:hypothetical protein
MSKNSEKRTCQNCKNEFVIDQEDFNFYQKIKVPAPTFCYLCRAQRRFAFRNERKLFKVKDAFTGKDIFSLYPPESEIKVITQDEWYQDNWDAMDYGRDYDFNKSFFAQLFELYKNIPIYGLNAQRMINSPYSGNATGLKNCYLCFNSNHSEDCLYGNGVDMSKDCVDNSHVKHSEKCYESFWLENCYQCYFSIMSADSRNLWFCRDCLGCNDCFGCANLRKASYCIFNKKYSKEEYENEIKKMRLDSASGVEQARKKARQFWKTQLIKCIQGIKNYNSTGSYVTNCKNVNDSYLIRESENLRYCQYMQVPGNKDCYDTTIWGEHTELCYECIECGENSYNNKLCRDCWPTCRENEYCMCMFSTSNCFGCVGLKKKQYCILNKQYEKDEYHKMVEKIKKHMNEVPYIDKKGSIYKYGEFFPIELSPFGYNNSLAIQHFPMTESEAKKNNYPWIEVSRGEYTITKKTFELLDSINEVDESILKEIMECEECNRPYRILENELIFLQKEKLPIPHLCHDCRHERRISDRLKVNLYERTCVCRKNR